MELVTKTKQEIMEYIEIYPYYQNYIIDNRVHDDYDGKEFIDVCPYCHKSFCD